MAKILYDQTTERYGNNCILRYNLLLIEQFGRLALSFTDNHTIGWQDYHQGEEREVLTIDKTSPILEQQVREMVEKSLGYTDERVPHWTKEIMDIIKGA